MSGKLYLCATPIGNLEDITLRVLRTLKEVDLIAAEDTRNSIKLLNHFEIKTPMTSYHEYNKIEKAYTLIEKMQNGMNIALITDAGTPGISDPGEELAAMCYEAGIEVTSLPGPAACITALTLSFAFEAFLPMDKKERKEVLEELVNETRTIILYEAPHKLVRTLRDLRETLGNRRMTLCRELTKKHETAFHSTIDDPYCGQWKCGCVKAWSAGNKWNRFYCHRNDTGNRSPGGKRTDYCSCPLGICMYGPGNRSRIL